MENRMAAPINAASGASTASADRRSGYQASVVRASADADAIVALLMRWRR